MGDVVQAAGRRVTCWLCGAESWAVFTDPEEARKTPVMFDAAPGVSRKAAAAEVLRILQDEPRAHNGPCGRPCSATLFGRKNATAREMCLGKQGCAACRKLREGNVK